MLCVWNVNVNSGLNQELIPDWLSTYIIIHAIVTSERFNATNMFTIYAYDTYLSDRVTDRNLVPSIVETYETSQHCPAKHFIND